MVSSATDARFYTLVGSYVPQFFDQDQLVHNTGSGTFVLTDTMADTMTFEDFTASQANERGQFKSCTDAMGNTISVTSYTSNGSVAQMQRTDGTRASPKPTCILTWPPPIPMPGDISNITLGAKNRQRLLDDRAAGQLRLLQRHPEVMATSAIS